MMEPRFFPNPSVFIHLSIQNCQTTIGIDRSCQCGHFGLCMFWKTSMFFLKTSGMFFFVFVNVFCQNGCKSYPFEELVVNLASWTPSNFGKYPKSPKWSSQSRPMTDFVRKGRLVKPHHASLFLSLVSAMHASHVANFHMSNPSVK